MNDEHGALQLGADFLEVFADLVAVARVVHHDEEHSLFAEGVVLGLALAPLLDAEAEVIVVFLGEDRTLAVGEFRAAGGVGEHGVLDDVLVDGLDERVIGNGLDEDGAVVVARGGGDVDLEREAAVLLEHLVVDVLDGFEPCHARIVDVVRLVVEDGEFLDLAHDLTEVGLAVGGLAGGLLAERVRKEVVAQIVVLQRRVADFSEKNTMDVGEEEIAGLTDESDIVLDVQRELEIVAPVAARVAVGRKNGVVEEDLEPVEIGTKAVEDDDVGCDEEEVPRKRGVGFVKAVKEAPCDEERENLRFAGAGREFEDVTRPVLGEHAAGYCAGGVEADQIVFVASAADLMKPDDGFDRLALGEVVAERRKRVISVLD